MNNKSTLNSDEQSTSLFRDICHLSKYLILHIFGFINKSIKLFFGQTDFISNQIFQVTDFNKTIEL